MPVVVSCLGRLYKHESLCAYVCGRASSCFSALFHPAFQLVHSRYCYSLESHENSIVRACKQACV